mmetsp:Transcript_20507/g.51113  ORF Transcript_20507/g.51113 Transcript_20507/m.51113 type:complete len:284 (-) Transcript_20507:95-946(-)
MLVLLSGFSSACFSATTLSSFSWSQPSIPPPSSPSPPSCRVSWERSILSPSLRPCFSCECLHFNPLAQRPRLKNSQGMVLGSTPSGTLGCLMAWPSISSSSFCVCSSASFSLSFSRLRASAFCCSPGMAFMSRSTSEMKPCAALPELFFSPKILSFWCNALRSLRSLSFSPFSLSLAFWAFAWIFFFWSARDTLGAMLTAAAGGGRCALVVLRRCRSVYRREGVRRSSRQREPGAAAGALAVVDETVCSAKKKSAGFFLLFSFELSAAGLSQPRGAPVQKRLL